MRNYYNLFMLMLFIGTTTMANAGLLEKTSFPTTINDIDRSNQTENKLAGYAPFKDADAYLAIQMESIHEELQHEIEQAEQEHEIFCIGPGRNAPECQPYTPPTQDKQPHHQQQDPQNQSKAPDDGNNNGNTLPNQNQTQQPSQDNKPIINGQSGQYCSLKHPHIPDDQTLPLGVPLSPELDVYAKAQRGLVCSGFSIGRGGGWKHHGADIGCGEKYFGTPVFASGCGRVVIVKHDNGDSTAGNYIVIEHANGFRSWYMHLDKIYVTNGQDVQAGCQIGVVGHTGGSVGLKRQGKSWRIPKSNSHLHYELTNSKHPSVMNTPTGTIQIKGYLKNSFDPIETLKYKH
ncbi:M23 family metallopeptidase [bacterium]|nr:M23 family metallopeptidase [bacterium]